ncbi:MAG: hypothetical protein AAFR90_13735 [Pseudomonadota bacterium]
MMERSNYPIIVASAIVGAITGTIALNAISAQAQNTAERGLVVHVPLSTNPGQDISLYQSAAIEACSRAGFRGGGNVVDVGNGRDALIACQP